jgi:hypothetical protein
MAYVATVAINDEHGNSLTSRRIAATAEEGPNEMMERLGAELRHIIEARQLPVVIVQDGAPELWNLVEEWFATYRIPVAMKLVDRYHVDERLAEIAELIEPDEHERILLRLRWRNLLDRTDLAMSRICNEIDNRVRGPRPKRPKRPKRDLNSDPDPFAGWPLDDPERPLLVTPSKARVIDEHITYYEHQDGRLRYATALKRGFPIGSGVTEGACKSVIACRLKRSGQRWFETGASACLHMRTLYLNERLSKSFEIFLDLRRGTLHET